MAEASGIREHSWLDVKGGGQITVDSEIAYVGHVNGPEATTIIDVADPKNPSVVDTIMCKHAGSHSHKVRVGNELMLTNSMRTQSGHRLPPQPDSSSSILSKQPSTRTFTCSM